jgi:alginate O-acetyltransferase complex protein AlgJ
MAPVADIMRASIWFPMWLAACSAEEPTAGPPASDRFFALLRSTAEEAEQAGKSVIPGAASDLLFVPELRSLGAGAFWGEPALQASRAPKEEHRDPLPAILDFKAQLDRAGVELLLVPVPAKVAVDPLLVPGAAACAVEAMPRVDVHHEAFYELLRQEGVQVLDLTPPFLTIRREKGPRLFCTQDTHWSGAACEIAARLVAERVQDREWLKGRERIAYTSTRREVEIEGDLWKMLGDAGRPKEVIELAFVAGADGAPPKDSQDSPVLLLGDSHCLVFHAGGDLHAVGAGFADHLALQLGMPIDTIGVRGSGATPSRVNLMRRGDGLRGKQLVVWCLSVREFTEGQGWAKVPVVKQ